MSTHFVAGLVEIHNPKNMIGVEAGLKRCVTELSCTDESLNSRNEITLKRCGRRERDIHRRCPVLRVECPAGLLGPTLQDLANGRIFPGNQPRGVGRNRLGVGRRQRLQRRSSLRSQGNAAKAEEQGDNRADDTVSEGHGTLLGLVIIRLLRDASGVARINRLRTVLHSEE